MERMQKALDQYKIKYPDELAEIEDLNMLGYCLEMIQR